MTLTLNFIVFLTILNIVQIYGQRKIIHTNYITSVISIDGKLNEEAWKSAKTVSDIVIYKLEIIHLDSSDLSRLLNMINLIHIYEYCINPKHQFNNQSIEIRRNQSNRERPFKQSFRHF